MTPRIRVEYKTLGVQFIEPPSGLGCDFVIFRNGRVTFVEVKEPGSEARMTEAERRLKRLCEVAGIPYEIVTTLDAALVAAGIVPE